MEETVTIQGRLVDHNDIIDAESLWGIQELILHGAEIEMQDKSPFKNAFWTGHGAFYSENELLFFKEAMDNPNILISEDKLLHKELDVYIDSMRRSGDAKSISLDGLDYTNVDDRLIAVSYDISDTRLERKQDDGLASMLLGDDSLVSALSMNGFDKLEVFLPTKNFIHFMKDDKYAGFDVYTSPERSTFLINLAGHGLYGTPAFFRADQKRDSVTDSLDDFAGLPVRDVVDRLRINPGYMKAFMDIYEKL